MKVRITHLKAPWPAGTVGDVVELPGDELPGWALGKCQPAGDDAEVTAAAPAAPEAPAVVQVSEEEAQAAAALAAAEAQAAEERAAMTPAPTKKSKGG